jgi:2-methylisocitrate lyase-like PEP mutase family enzyme
MKEDTISVEQLESIVKPIRNAPVLVNVAPKTPYLPVSRYGEMGFARAIYPPCLLQPHIEQSEKN